MKSTVIDPKTVTRAKAYALRMDGYISKQCKGIGYGTGVYSLRGIDLPYLPAHLCHAAL